MKRHVIEGTWSGFVAGQRHVVHREVTIDRRRVEGVRKLGCIRYADGTVLYLSVRETKPRERVLEMLGYERMISDCIASGTSLVEELVRKWP